MAFTYSMSDPWPITEYKDLSVNDDDDKCSECSKDCNGNVWPTDKYGKPLNNDGRATCRFCGGPTREINLGLLRSRIGHICTRCGK